MTEDNKSAARDVDLDEDLFDFEGVMPNDPGDIESEIDLDEIFAAFQEKDGSADVEAAAAGSGTAPSNESAEESTEDAGEEPFEAPEPEPAVAAAAPDAQEGKARASKAPAPSDAPAATPSPAAEKQPKPAPSEAPAPAKAAPHVAPSPVERLAAIPRGRSAAPSAPAATAAPGRSRSAALMTRSAVVVLIAMTLLNLSIALVTFGSATDMKGELEAASREMADAALSIRDQVDQQATAVQKQFSPLTAPQVEEHPTLDRAEADIEVGNYTEARKRIFALLAVIDRQPDATRDELEARATYLLARSYHAEALALEDAE